MPKLYCILVPTRYGDNNKPISTKHHKRWDDYLIKITGGLTIAAPSKGKWKFEGQDFFEKVIPVYLMCEEKHIDKIIKFTINHYRQKAVMWYVVTEQVNITRAKT